MSRYISSILQFQGEKDTPPDTYIKVVFMQQTKVSVFIYDITYIVEEEYKISNHRNLTVFHNLNSGSKTQENGDNKEKY